MVATSLIRQQSALLARTPLPVRHRDSDITHTLLILNHSGNVYSHREPKSDTSISSLRSRMAIYLKKMG